MSLVWHPSENILCFANSDGEVFIYNDFVPQEHLTLLKKPLQPAPFIHDPLAELSVNVRKPLANRADSGDHTRHKRRRTPDSLDDILGSVAGDDESDFIVDDDGAGYADGINGFGKRIHPTLEGLEGPPEKRRATYAAWKPTWREPFQPGSTPWRGNRRYLCKRHDNLWVSASDLSRSQLGGSSLECGSRYSQHGNRRVL